MYMNSCYVHDHTVSFRFIIYFISNDLIYFELKRIYANYFRFYSLNIFCHVYIDMSYNLFEYYLIVCAWQVVCSGSSKTYTNKPQTSGNDLKMKTPREPQRGPTGDDMVRTDKSKMRADESRRVTIIIGELGFSSDLGFQKTVDRKQHKYAPLIEELERERAGTLDPRYT